MISREQQVQEIMSKANEQWGEIEKKFDRKYLIYKSL